MEKAGFHKREKAHTCQSGRSGKLASRRQPHQPPEHGDDLLPKWRLQLMELTEEALGEIEGKEAASTPERSKPSLKTRPPT